MTFRNKKKRNKKRKKKMRFSNITLKFRFEKKQGKKEKEKMMQIGTAIVRWFETDLILIFLVIAGREFCI